MRMNNFKINPEIKKYIKLQRPGYGEVDFPRRYYENVLHDYNIIRMYLPETCDSVLDIGCGIGGIDIMLYNHYKEKPFLNMYDYAETSDKIYYGYWETAAVYNSLEATADFLKLNGVDRKDFETYDAHGAFIEQDYDIIISLIAMGFHFPVETYLQQIKKCNPKVVILDIRKDTNQIDLLKDNFAEVEPIMDWERGARYILK